MVLYTSNGFPGGLNGPYLWFCLASLNLIDLFDPVIGMVPITVSPARNVPLTIETSISFGTIKLVTLILSKKAYNLVVGFNLLATTSMFLDLIKVIIDLETTLSPSEVVSNLSVTPN